MQKYKKQFLATALCLIPFLLLFVNLAPASAASGWQVGYNLARDNSQLPENELRVVIFAFLQWLLLAFTFISVIAFVIAGIMFLTSGSNPQQAEQAKKYVFYAIIGVAVGISGYVILGFVDVLMGGEVQIQG